MRVSAIQLCSGADPDGNVADATRLVRQAAASGAEYVQLPEYFHYLGPETGYPAAAEPISGPIVGAFRDLARELGVAVHLGSMIEPSDEPVRCYNTSVLVDRAGEIVGLYRKIHLFDIEVPGEVEDHESASIVPGSELCVATVGPLDIGMTVCFDLRFPEIYRQLLVAGATVLAVPAAFSVPTGRVHWEVLLRARAIENLAFVIAAGQAGVTTEGIATYGHSLIVNPWGQILAEGNGEKEEVVVADLDIDEVARRRAQIDILGLRRPDVYASTPRCGEVR